MDRSTPGCPSSYNGQTGLGQTTSVGSASVRCGTGTTTTGGQGPNTQGSKYKRVQIGRTPVPPSASGAKVGAT